MGYDGFAEAVKASRMRATFTRAIVDFGDGCGDRLEDSEALYRKYHGAGNLSVMMSLHGEYTCTENTARKLVDMARELKTGIHRACFRNESRARRGYRAARFDADGIFGQNRRDGCAAGGGRIVCMFQKVI